MQSKRDGVWYPGVLNLAALHSLGKDPQFLHLCVQIVTVPSQASRSQREAMPGARGAPTQEPWTDPQLASRALALCYKGIHF